MGLNECFIVICLVIFSVHAQWGGTLSGGGSWGRGGFDGGFSGSLSRTFSNGYKVTGSGSFNSGGGWGVGVGISIPFGKKRSVLGQCSRCLQVRKLNGIKDLTNFGKSIEKKSKSFAVISEYRRINQKSPLTTIFNIKEVLKPSSSLDLQSMKVFNYYTRKSGCPPACMRHVHDGYYILEGNVVGGNSIILNGFIDKL